MPSTRHASMPRLIPGPQPLRPAGALALSLLVTAALLPMPAARAAAPAASSPARAALTVTVSTPQSSALDRVLAANGNISAWQEVVISAETQGLRLVEVNVQVGDRVSTGQVLARLQHELLGADLQTRQAQIVEADATLAEAQANAERARALQPSGALSAQQLEQYQTAETAARARLQALQAQRSADALRLAQTRITARDDGIISARSATVGAIAQPGQELFRLIRQSRLEWRAEVPAADLGQIRPGMAVDVTPVGGRPIRARVRSIAPTVDPATRLALVYVDLPAGSAARAGMYARGEFSVGRSSAALTLPQTAVLLRDGHAYAFRIGADGKVLQTRVQTGRRLGDRIEITGGLAADARVVTQGAGFLADGDTVRIVAAPAPPAPAGSR
ncbi:efflux RND transporter periplasmic adaptor subunit [Sphaerotilus hippei]|nr:efflux RND transporter periplasmic adaptor subunit [Sphaerotilus hippei]